MQTLVVSISSFRAGKMTQAYLPKYILLGPPRSLETQGMTEFSIYIRF